MTSTLDAPTGTASPARHLVCRGCGAQFPLAAQHACFECFGPLEVGYDPAAFTRFACASTGNLANSVAAHSARAGVPSIVFVPADLEPGKIITTAVYGGDLVAIDGSYDDVNRLCSELIETDEFENTAFVNVNVRPYYAEGSKTLGYEVAEQLGWRIPAQVVVPMASGCLLTKIDKAFSELVEG